MTRFVIDAPTLLHLVAEGVRVAPQHQLVAPNVLRSQALSLLYREVRRGDLAKAQARTLLDGITTMKIRLLGDRVSRSVAWQLAEQLDAGDTVAAEYLAVARLQADALVTSDPDLARQARGVVSLAPFEALLRT